MFTALLARVCSLSKRFLKNENGNIAAIFALSLLPVLSFVGVAVDYSRANSARTSMQAALDSATLMVAKEAAGLSTAALVAKAEGYFRALYTGSGVTGIQVTTAYTQQSGGSPAKVVMTATGSMATTFMGLIGFNSLNLSTASTASWANSKLRVAMVLDVTGSMNDSGKLTALKAAAKKLVTTLSGSAATNGDVYISVVPFAKDVNIGKTNYSQPFIDWTDWESANQTCDWRGRNCTVNSHSTWNGCVTDRTEPYDTASTAPTSLTTDFPAEQYDSCPAALLPLTYDFSSVNSKIDSLSPAGGTNQPIGLFWGWWTLRSTAPFAAPAKDPNVNYVTAIILLTDGLNTQQRNPSYGNGQVQYGGKIDARQKILCDSIKSDGVTLYTIQVNTDGEATSTVLPYCASSPEKFFILTSSTQIMSAFDNIGASLSKLRIAK